MHFAGIGMPANTHGQPQDFFTGWAMRVWRTKSSVGSRGSSPAGVWGEPPRSWRHFLKMMHKYFVYWGFRQHFQQKTLLNIPREGKCPLAHACKRPCWHRLNGFTSIVKEFPGLSLHSLLGDPTSHIILHVLHVSVSKMHNILRLDVLNGICQVSDQFNTLSVFSLYLFICCSA